MAPPHSERAQSTRSVSGPERWRLAWLLLGVAYTMFGFLFSVIQPLTAIPDESAHMEYVRFLAEQRRLPVWNPDGGGEAGYETQHPPLAYAVLAIPYALSAALPENMRWHVVRWSMVPLGWLLLCLLRRLGRQLFPDREGEVCVFAATVLLMPLSLLYLCHANPDGPALVLSAAALLTALRIHSGEKEHAALPWVAGLLAALAGLTKLSAMPLAILLLLSQWFRPGQTPRARLRRCAVILGVWGLGAGWWYVRNLFYYGTPFIHTPTIYGSGLKLSIASGLGRTALYTAVETFTGAWAQRGWLPYRLEAAIYPLILLASLAAITGFVTSRKRREQNLAEADPGTGPRPASRFACVACTGLLGTVLIGQQAAFWLVDMELNAGGRYLLVALPATAFLVLEGVSRLRSRLATRSLFALWIAGLLVMNLASARRITGVLNPKYFPGWRMFEFPRR